MSFKLLLLQLGFACSTAADKLQFILSDSQCLRAFNQGFLFFFLLFVFCFGWFYFRKRKSAHIYEKYPFHVFFEATDGTSWRNTASRHRNNVHFYDKLPVWGYFRVDQPTLTCFKWHTSTTVYLQRTSDCSNSH